MNSSTHAETTMHSTNGLTVYEASTFFQRLRGLLGRTELSDSEALHIAPCADVHSFGMKYSLDIVFLNDEGDVLKTGVLEPNSWMKCKGAKSVIEMRAGCAKNHGIVVGESLGAMHTRTIGDRNEH